MSLYTYTPYQDHFLDICRIAYLKGASDIHFEPTAKDYTVRYRIDGTLIKADSIPLDVAETFHSENKTLMNFDPHIIGVPQDARFSHPSEMVDFRANLMCIFQPKSIIDSNSSRSLIPV